MYDLTVRDPGCGMFDRLERYLNRPVNHEPGMMARKVQKLMELNAALLFTLQFSPDLQIIAQLTSEMFSEVLLCNVHYIN